MDASLVCPSCDTAHASEERFCRDCGVPLVRADAEEAGREPASRLRQRARKVKPQYAEGELTFVARAGNQAEAELVQNMLLEEGIPSMTKRSGGFDVPDFLAAGPRDVLVPRSGAEAARDLLAPRLPGSGGAGDAREV